LSQNKARRTARSCTPKTHCAVSSIPPPRLRHSVACSLVGNIGFALSQWILLTNVSKLGGAQMVGELALALAITSPIFLFTGLQLNTVQITDTFDRFTFGDYLAIRITSTALALVFIVMTLMLWSQSRTTTIVTMLIAGAKALDSVSDVIYGFFRKHERMDLTATSMIFKSIASVVVFAAALFLSSRLTWAACGLALTGCVTLAAYDFPRLRRLSRLAGLQAVRLAPHWSAEASGRLIKITFPMGLSAMLASLNTNIPRYFIEHLLGEKSLGFFAGTTYITMAGTFVVSAVAQAVLPRLASYYTAGDLHALKAVLLRLSAMSFGIGVAGIAFSAVAGRQVLSIVYRPEYGAYSTLLTFASCAATVAYVASIMNCALNAVHRYSQQLPLIAATVCATAFACFLLIPAYSMNGAALALTAGYGLQAAGSAIIVGRALRSLKRDRILAHA